MVHSSSFGNRFGTVGLGHNTVIPCSLKVFKGIVLEVPCLGSIEMGTLRSENLRDDGVSTSSKCNQEGVKWRLYLQLQIYECFFQYLRYAPNSGTFFIL